MTHGEFRRTLLSDKTRWLEIHLDNDGDFKGGNLQKMLKNSDLGIRLTCQIFVLPLLEMFPQDVSIVTSRMTG